MAKSYTKPIILIVSSSNTKPKSIIKLITGENFQHSEESMEIYHPWTIDTKYYTADVDIFGISENYIRTDKFNDTVEALVIHMDTNKESGLEDLEKWSSIQTDCDPEIKLLLCNYCTCDTKISKSKATEWCLKRGFELVELYPNISNSHDHSDDDSEEEIIKEKFGVDRVVEALQTHVWSNLVMKNKAEDVVYVGCNVDFSHNSTNNKPVESSLEDDHAMLTNLVGNEGIDDFNELFSQLHMIKESMKTMPASQRKQCAEHMVTAFWHAIGGDEEELADL